MSGITMPWYALMVKARHEKVVAAALRWKGYTEFLPLYRRRYLSAGRLRTSDLPLFPTYVFCRFDATQRFPVISVPGVFGIVTVGGYPVPVNEEELTGVQILARSDLDLAPWEEKIKRGDEVVILDGPLRGAHGTVVNVKGATCLVISVTLLQRSVSVELDRTWVTSAASRTAESRTLTPGYVVAQ